jgi:hypothetical protein
LTPPYLAAFAPPLTAQAPALIPAGSAEVICDRGYDADWWRERLVTAGHRPVIPGRRNRLV